MLRLFNTRWLVAAVCLTATLCSSALSQEPPGGFTRYPDCESGPLSSFDICDSSLPVERRAASLVALLNVSEKVTRVGESYGDNGIERIGLPNIHFRQNAIHGLGPGVLWTERGQDWSNCTMFPHVINMAASFNRRLFNAVGAATSDEARAFANVGRAGLDWFTPNINIFRDPRWGRGQETPGEDPYLSSEFAVYFVRGLQEGDDTRFIKTIADCKHYAGYDLEHWGLNPEHPEDRSFYNANITDQELVESYLPPFEACVTSARVGSVMCSYNAVNGVPSCANSFFLQTILRDRFHFDPSAFVVSDCGAISQLYTAHHYTATPELAVAAALKAGVDLDCGPYYSQWGRQAYSQGLITDTELDRALMRQFSSLIRLGYFDPAADQVYRQYGAERVNSGPNQEVALTAALQSIVLLKLRERTLPLAVSAAETVAVIGPSANATELLLGNYEAPPPYIVSVLAALQRRNVSVVYAKGCDINSSDRSGFDDAVKAAAQATAVIYVGGLDQSIEAEGRDRYSIELPGQQLALIAALAKAAHFPIAVVILSGGQVDLSALKSDDRIGALLWGGYPGQSGGEAIVRVLTGEHSPSGRLPSTQYPAEYVKQVPMTDQSFRPSATSPGRTYKFYTGEAVYPFGFGLSFTSVSVKIVGQQPAAVPLAQLSQSPIAYSVNVTNTGHVASDITVLAYLTFNSSAVDFPSLPSPPISQLFDFAFIPMLRPGQTVTIFFQLTAEALRLVDSRGHEWLLPGLYGVRIDEGQASTTLRLQGEPTLLRKWEGSDVVEQPVTAISRDQQQPASRVEVE